MGKIKVGIVEDEAIIAQGIANALEELGYDTTGFAVSYTEALGMIVEEQPDILLIDIVLKGHKDGIDLAQKVRQAYNIPFIFLTANSDVATVERAKKVFPPAYLVKPFNKNELYASIEICLNNFSLAKNKMPSGDNNGNYFIKDHLFIKQGKAFEKIKINDILYLESNDIYIHVYTSSGKFLVRSSLQAYLDTIGPQSMLRIHKGFAVNANQIDKVDGDSIFIKGKQLPIGRAYNDEVRRFLRLG
jgi:DNA-binding LytR/AlgR family response regulator